MARGALEKIVGPWLPDIAASSGPIYRGIVKALADDVASGRLRAGDPIPSQRDLAERLGINFTTVTRAYTEARARGLIVTKAGQGTFVGGGEATRHGKGQDQIDLSSNWPPIVPALSLVRDTLRSIISDKGASAIQSRGNPLRPHHFEAGRLWLSDHLGGDPGDRLTISSGARGALIAVLSQVVGPGGVLLTEHLAWPAIKAVTKVLGITAIGVDTDEEGIVPDAIRRACRVKEVRALYCTPTVQNPTAGVMSRQRRLALADVARECGLTIVEDDAYGHLVPQAPPPVAALAPDVTFYISGLAKTLSPGLRVGYVVCPRASDTQQVEARLSSTMLLPPPLEAEVATRLITSGASRIILAEIGDEMRIRHDLLESILCGIEVRTVSGALHAYLPLPGGRSRTSFISELLGMGVRAASMDPFAMSPAAIPEALRLSIGAPGSVEDLRTALDAVSCVYRRDVDFSDLVV